MILTTEVIKHAHAKHVELERMAKSGVSAPRRKQPARKRATATATAATAATASSPRRQGTLPRHSQQSTAGTGQAAYDAYGGYSTDSSVRGGGGGGRGRGGVRLPLHGRSPLRPSSHLPDAAIAALRHSPFRGGAAVSSGAVGGASGAEMDAASMADSNSPTVVGSTVDRIRGLDEGAGPDGGGGGGSAAWHHVPSHVSHGYGAEADPSGGGNGSGRDINGEAARFVEQVMAESGRYKQQAAAAAAAAAGDGGSDVGGVGGDADGGLGKSTAAVVHTPRLFFRAL